MRKLFITHSYENSFEIEIPDDATEEEILKMAIEEDEYLGGDWSTSWQEIEGDDDALLR